MKLYLFASQNIGHGDPLHTSSVSIQSEPPADWSKSLGHGGYRMRVPELSLLPCCLLLDGPSLPPYQIACE